MFKVKEADNYNEVTQIDLHEIILRDKDHGGQGFQDLEVM